MTSLFRSARAAILVGAFSISFLIVASPASASMLQEQDKQMHFAVSTSLGLASSQFFLEKERGPLKAFAIAMIPGLAKEVYDSRSGGTGFSGRDMLANAMGAALGVGLGNGIHLMLERHRNGESMFGVRFTQTWD